MTTQTTGNVSVSVLAGPIRTTGQWNPTIGQQVTMGDSLYFHITPEVAAQWISVLETISKEA